jgi:hypothetical protein
MNHLIHERRLKNMREQRNGIALSEQARKARNSAHREWAKNNREKVKKIQARYWEHRALRQKED